MSTEPQTIPLPTGFSAESLAGKYLTFSIGKESYGVSVLKILEIIRMQDITPVPQMPEDTKGVVNLRGKIVPIIDLRIKFGIKNIKNTELTCIVISKVTTDNDKTAQIGLIVDAVEEVTQIPALEMDERPNFGRGNDQNYILGMAKVKGRVKTLLNIDNIMKADRINIALSS